MAKKETEKKEKKTRARYGDGCIRERSPGHFQIIIPGPPQADKKRKPGYQDLCGSLQGAQLRVKRRMQYGG